MVQTETVKPAAKRGHPRKSIPQATNPPEVVLVDIAFAGRLRGLFEKTRVAAQVHMTHLAADGKRDPLAEEIFPELEAMEERIEARIRSHFQRDHIWAQVWQRWGGRVKGSGPMVLGAVMSRCDIVRLETVSALWAHAGFAPSQKRTAGEKITWDPVLKTWCWRLATQLLRANGMFKASYDQRRVHELAAARKRGVTHIVYIKQPDEGQKAISESLAPFQLQATFVTNSRTLEPHEMAAAHVHVRAQRHMLKTFLACLWLIWREAAGLRTRPLYILEHPDQEGNLHTTFYRPESFYDKGMEKGEA